MLEEMIESAIAVTKKGIEVLVLSDPDDPVIDERRQMVMRLQWNLNWLRGFDPIAMGC